MEDMIECPECERRFSVTWLNDGLGSPEYCPMCGAEIDYSVLKSPYSE